MIISEYRWDRNTEAECAVQARDVSQMFPETDTTDWFSIFVSRGAGCCGGINLECWKLVKYEASTWNSGACLYSFQHVLHVIKVVYDAFGLQVVYNFLEAGLQ